jgi:LysM repeat protein
LNRNRKIARLWATIKKHPVLAMVLLIMVCANALLIALLARTMASAPSLTLAVQATPSPVAPEATATANQPDAPLSQVVTLTPTAPIVRASPTPTRAAAPVAAPLFEGPIVYGASYGGRALTAFRVGNGPSARAIIGGIHGGYEWNTVDLVSQTLTYLRQEPSLVPSELTLYLIPCMNPDGYAAGTDPVRARMNGRGVDLNRNWDYQWQMTATHGTRPVSAGTGAFSEPETAALRDLMISRRVESAIFYHSALAKIFVGADMTRSASLELAQVMSQATGYPLSLEGVPGQITTGDAIDWLSTQGIAAIEVELTTHQDIEWERNRRGLLAFLNWSIPGRAPKTPMSTTGQFITYTVQSGDTPWSIAARHKISVEDLLRANGLTDKDTIQPGQSLRIPVRSE